jgi:hypothetical protein
MHHVNFENLEVTKRCGLHVSSCRINIQNISPLLSQFGDAREHVLGFKFHYCRVEELHHIS